MQQTVSMRLRIIPDSCQAELLKRTMKVYSEACNYVSDYIFRTHDLTQSGLQKALYYSIRESFFPSCPDGSVRHAYCYIRV